MSASPLSSSFCLSFSRKDYMEPPSPRAGPSARAPRPWPPHGSHFTNPVPPSRHRRMQAILAVGPGGAAAARALVVADATKKAVAVLKAPPLNSVLFCTND
ncbi:Os10g0209433 [Oryza sativa Japonica Group]|uniref:Os10g0209433 protein n=1 Tax=Oryza sativa subsp. japonica TaxID=39947 RepID=A0A0P0XSJ1_ORYSJ|nr:Os10g0209433 [Oryza sativa Japonica Group]